MYRQATQRHDDGDGDDDSSGTTTRRCADATWSTTDDGNGDGDDDATACVTLLYADTTTTSHGSNGRLARRSNNNNNNSSSSSSNSSDGDVMGPPYPGVSFAGDKRVCERRSCVRLGGRRFVIVERAVRENERASMYARSRAAWQHIAIGQACVFVEQTRTPHKPPSLSSPSPLRDAKRDDNNDARDTHEYACVGTLGGLRHFGHWDDVVGGVTSSSSNDKYVYTTTSSAAAATAASCTVDGSDSGGDATTSPRLHAPHLRVTALERIDGEGGQVAAVRVGSARYWLVGCHACHLLVRLRVPEADVAAYDVQRYNDYIVCLDNNRHDDDNGDGRGGRHSESNNNNNARMQWQRRQQQTSPCVACIGAGTTAARRVALAQHMARAWRRLLQRCVSHRVATTTATSSTSWAAVEALHDTMTLRRWTLCFSAVVQGYEQLVDYWAAHDDDDEQSDNDKDDDDEETKPQAQSNASPLWWWLPPQQQQQHVGLVARAHVRRQPTLLRFFAITTSSSHNNNNNNNNSNNGAWCVPTRDALALFAHYHLPTVRVYKLDDDDDDEDEGDGVDVCSAAYAALRQRIASAVCSAGAVCYGSDTHDRVVRVWKCRCHAHTLERAAQEGVVTHRLHGTALRLRLQKKHASLSRDARACTAAWVAQRLPLLTSFATWLHHTRVLTPTTSVAVLRELRAHWLTLQRAYARATRAARLRAPPRHVDVYLATDKHDNDDDDDDDDDVVVVADNDSRHSDADDSDASTGAATDVILLTGPQGSGKSTLARALCVLLEQAGCTPRWVNQDELGGRHAYMAAIARACGVERATHVVLDKINLNEDMRAEYERMQLKVVVSVAWSHPHGSDALARVCVDRVRRRGVHHRTLHATTTTHTHAVAATHTVDAAAAATLSSTRTNTTTTYSNSNNNINSNSNNNSGGCRSRAAPPPVEAIVRRCAAQYEPPCDASVLMLDVGLPADAVVARVWSRLRERGLYELPELTSCAAAQALRVSVDFERLLPRYPFRVRAAVVRACDAHALRTRVAVALASPQRQTCREVAALDGNDYSTCYASNNNSGSGDDAVGDVCATVHDFAQQPCAAAFVHYAALAGRVVHVQLRRVVHDADVTLVLLGDVVTQPQPTPHHDDSRHTPADVIYAPLRSHRCGRGYGAHTATVATATATPRHAAHDNNDDDDDDVVYAVVARTRRADARYCDALARAHAADAVAATTKTTMTVTCAAFAPDTYVAFRYDLV